MAKYLNKIKDPGYMKYKALADKLKENGYDDATELIYGKRPSTISKIFKTNTRGKVSVKCT